MSSSSAPLAVLAVVVIALLGAAVASLVSLDRLPMDPALRFRRRVLTGIAAVSAGGVVIGMGLMTSLA